jgi:hypothetical protein
MHGLHLIRFFLIACWASLFLIVSTDQVDLMLEVLLVYRS